jgi:glycosyltransferase involved in cell wall biosynthesis
VPVDVIVPVFRDNVALERLLIGLGDGPLLQRMRVVFGEADAIGEALAERYGVAWSRANRAGRAMQMNHGSVIADGEVLLFLHADSRLPRDALDAIEKAVREGAVGGAFTRRFESPSHFLRLTCWLADWRGRAFGIFLGDQGLFVRRDAFEALGGFDGQTLYEDLDFSLRLRQAGRTVMLTAVLQSSARRFAAKGPVGRSLLDMQQVVLFVVRRLFR